MSASIHIHHDGGPCSVNAELHDGFISSRLRCYVRLEFGNDSVAIHHGSAAALAELLEDAARKLRALLPSRIAGVPPVAVVTCSEPGCAAPAHRQADTRPVCLQHDPFA